MTNELIFKKEFCHIALPNYFNEGETKFDEWFNPEKMSWEESGVKFNDFDFIQNLNIEDKSYKYYLCYFNDCFTKFPRAWGFQRIRIGDKKDGD